MDVRKQWLTENWATAELKKNIRWKRINKIHYC